jgi:hypothetical protein
MLRWFRVAGKESRILSAISVFSTTVVSLLVKDRKTNAVFKANADPFEPKVWPLTGFGLMHPKHNSQSSDSDTDNDVEKGIPNAMGAAFQRRGPFDPYQSCVRCYWPRSICIRRENL